MGNSKRETPSMDNVGQGEDLHSDSSSKKLTYQDTPIPKYPAEKRPDLPSFGANGQNNDGKHLIDKRKHLEKIVEDIVAKRLVCGHELESTREGSRGIKQGPTTSSGDSRVLSRYDRPSSKHNGYKSPYQPSDNAPREINRRKNGQRSQSYRTGHEHPKRSSVFSRLSDRRPASAPIATTDARFGYRGSGWDNRGYSGNANVANDTSRSRHYRPPIASKLSNSRSHSEMRTSKATRTSSNSAVSDNESLIFWNPDARKQVLSSLRKRFAERELSIAGLIEKIKHYRALNKESKVKLEKVRTFLQ